MLNRALVIVSFDEINFLSDKILELKHELTFNHFLSLKQLPESIVSSRLVSNSF